MIRFDQFHVSQDNNPLSSCEKTTTGTSSTCSKSSIAVTLDFDCDSPANSKSLKNPEKLVNLFLKKDKKSLSDSTPTLKLKKVMGALGALSAFDKADQQKNQFGEKGSINIGSFLSKPDPEESQMEIKGDFDDDSESGDREQGIFKDFLLPSSTPLITKSHSYMGKIIKSEKLVFDKPVSCSKISPFTASFNFTPITSTRTPELPSMAAEEVAKLLKQDSSACLIVDCRFDFEYKGGHIKGAINILSLQVLEQVFFTHKNLLRNPAYVEDLKKDLMGTLAEAASYAVPEPEADQKLPKIIFHCEFSQKRGPRAFRNLRNKDRELNIKYYPRLDYPDIYMLAEGYCAFHSKFSNLCEGGYVKMVDRAYKSELAVAKENDKLLWGKRNSINF